MDNEETPKRANQFINIIIAQAVCVTVILLSVLVLKYFFKGEYKDVKGWYSQEIAMNTDINEVLK